MKTLTMKYAASTGYGKSTQDLHALALELAREAVEALFEDPWARVVIVHHQHDGGAAVHVGDGLDSPIVEVLRVLPSWTVGIATEKIIGALRPLAVFKL